MPVDEILKTRAPAWRVAGTTRSAHRADLRYRCPAAAARPPQLAPDLVQETRAISYIDLTDRTALSYSDFLDPRYSAAEGQKRTFHYVAFDVAFGGKADMSLCAAHVCF